MRAFTLAPVLLGLLLAGTTDLARGQTRDSKAFAREHVESGRQHFAAKEYDEAIDDWKQAYLLDPSVDTLFSIAEAQRLKGDCKEALISYRTVLREEPPEAMVKQAKQGIALCEAQGAKAAAPAATAAPAPEPEEMPAPEPVPDHDAPGEDRSPWYADGLGDTLAVLGLIGVGAGATFWILSGRDADAANAAATFDDFDDHAAAAGSERKIAIGAFAAGGALVAAAIVRWATRDGDAGGGDGDDDGPPHVSAAPSPGGLVLVVGGAF